MSDEYSDTCVCGRLHKYPPYVIAHMNVELSHICGCGRENTILNLVAVIGNLPNKSVKPTKKELAKNLKV